MFTKILVFLVFRNHNYKKRDNILYKNKYLSIKMSLFKIVCKVILDII